MFRLIFILLFSINLFATDKTEHCTCIANNELSTTAKIIACGLGAVAFAPFVLTASTVSILVTAAAATKSAGIAIATKAGAYIVSTTVVGKVSAAVTITNVAIPYVSQTTEEKLNALLKDRNLKLSKSKKEFVRCLVKNKTNTQKDTSGRPVACDEAALRYALTAGISELDKRTDAFNNNKCYCR